MGEGAAASKPPRAPLRKPSPAQPSPTRPAPAPAPRRGAARGAPDTPRCGSRRRSEPSYEAVNSAAPLPLPPAHLRPLTYS